ncbi:MarR family winged helix-turn-helix transcriptional regulator [Vibrio europaeus]|uniref:MarR family winged helix-turn-helix transcriptional regulator n=1 Tax=Vibrio europaeus TaxID=300876 RepID=UPI0039DF711E
MSHVENVVTQWERIMPESDFSPLKVCGELERAYHLLQKSLSPVFRKYGVNRTEFDILATLRRSESDLTPTLLHKTLLLTSGAISARLEHLHRRGLIERNYTPDDRRSCFITLSDEGKNLIDDAFVSYMEAEALFVEKFTSEEQANITNILRKLLK